MPKERLFHIQKQYSKSTTMPVTKKPCKLAQTYAILQQ